MHDSDSWNEVVRNPVFSTLLPLFEKIFSLRATSTPVEQIFSYSGLIMRPNRAHMGDMLLSQLVFLRCNDTL